MRKPNPTSKCPARNLCSNVLLLVFVVSVCGCSQLQNQAGFEPIPQPKSLAERQQRPVEEILRRQDEARVAAANEEQAQLQKEVVADAAERAKSEDPIPTVAQVSFETDVEEAMADQEAAQENFIEPLSESSVKLIANADDFENIPDNIAQDNIDFSQANFLRPSNTSEPTKIPDPEAVTQTRTQPVGEETSSSLLLPLRPMLFNAETRSRKSTLEGTLRPLEPRVAESNLEVAVERTDNPEDTTIESTNALSPLQPLSPATATVQTESTTSAIPIETAKFSRLLGPIERSTFSPTPRPAIEPTEVVAVKETESETVVISEEIFVVDPPTPVEEEVADFSPAPKAEDVNSFQPAFENEQANFVPAEVIEDAIAFAEAIEQEMTAEVIPSEEIIEVENNDFKVQMASNTTVTKVKFDNDVVRPEPGEPLFTNNEFAEPSAPGGQFVPPMTVVPAEVPVAIPDRTVTASDRFGAPVKLKAPDKADPAVAHIASLPVNPYEEATVKPSSSVPPVGLSTLMDLNTVTWKSRLDQAIELAETRLSRITNPSESSIVNLRLLKVLRQQMEHVENAPKDTLSKNESQYWQHQLEAITSMLGTPEGENQAITDYHRHQTAHKTLEHLRNAVEQLESIASLRVNSGQFCTEITGFGQFRTFASNTFVAGQKMLIYCEVENFKTVQHQSATGNDFRTRLRGSFAIYDTSGKVVQQAEFPTVDDIARKKRRDFYMYMPVTLGDLPSGDYVLHALVEDISGNKTASLDPPLQFSIK